jgi:hypothetical protein
MPDSNALIFVVDDEAVIAQTLAVFSTKQASKRGPSIIRRRLLPHSWSRFRLC